MPHEPAAEGIMYTSQTELCVRAQDALKSSSHFVLRQLVVDDVNECLVISGKVETYYQKQQAQELVRSVASGKRVENEVKVAVS